MVISMNDKQYWWKATPHPTTVTAAIVPILTPLTEGSGSTTLREGATTMSRLTIGPVRLSYAYLFEPRPASTPGAKAKYGATLLIPKAATKTVAAVQAAIEQTKIDYKGKFPKAVWINNPRTTLYDGDSTRPSGEPFGPECAAHWVLSTSSQKQPLVVDQAKNPILDATQIYSGAFALAIINFYAYDTQGNKGIACALDGVMKTADGEPLGGNVVSANAFDNVAADDLAALNTLLG